MRCGRDMARSTPGMDVAVRPIKPIAMAND